ncbi:hypothetical protein ABTI69_21005, partial [Acinetobacter baumannii]
NLIVYFCTIVVPIVKISKSAHHQKHPAPAPAPALSTSTQHPAPASPPPPPLQHHYPPPIRAQLS